MASSSTSFMIVISLMAAIAAVLLCCCSANAASVVPKSLSSDLHSPSFAYGQFKAVVHFFNALTPSQDNRLDKFLTNPNMTQPQRAQLLTEFATAAGILDYVEVLREWMKQAKEVEQQVAAKYLAPSAFNVYQQIRAILADDTKLRGDQCSQVAAVLKRNDDALMMFLPLGTLNYCYGMEESVAASQMQMAAAAFVPHQLAGFSSPKMLQQQLVLV